MQNGDKGAYVVGLIFDLRERYVLLQEKRRPQWMAEKFNGCGGRIEYRETPVQAMVREAEEETGLKSLPSEWHEFHREFRHDGVELHFFCIDRTSLKDVIGNVNAEEKLRMFGVENLNKFRDGVFVYNIRYLVPMALSLLQNDAHYYYLDPPTPHAVKKTIIHRFKTWLRGRPPKVRL